MWNEARKQEKALKGMMVNFQRRAERRREYYERTVSVHSCQCVGMSANIADRMHILVFIASYPNLWLFWMITLHNRSVEQY